MFCQLFLIKSMALAMTESPLQQGEGVQGRKIPLGALGPSILKQLPLEVEGSEVSTIRGRKAGR